MLHNSWTNSVKSASNRLGLPRPRHGSRQRRRTNTLLTVERMEERTLLSTFWVTNTGDDGGVNPAPRAGTGTLRQAIIDANADAANTAADAIDFNIPGTGVQTIQPLSELPAVTHPVVIDGYSQQGSKPNDLAQGDDAVLLIELDGSNAGGARGLWISGGGSKVMGLVINRFESYGIHLTDTGGNVVEGNFIGTDPSGEIPLGNALGVVVQCDGNRIGADGSGSSDIPEGQSDYAERNLVSANDNTGIGVEGSHNVVAGNFVGTDATGTKPLGNHPSFGVGVSGYDNRIGADGHDADASAERNVISGNGGGVGLQGGGQNVVAGNFIGTDVTGALAVGNGVGVNGDGVIIQQSNGNFIGTNGDGVGDAFERNIISANQGDGVEISGGNNNVVAGNFIGTDVTGTQPLGNYSEGINLNYGSSFNRIGTDGLSVDNFGERNIISSNIRGIRLGSGAPGQGNFIAGNWIGVGSDGRPLGNGFPVYPGGPSGGIGILIEGDSSDQIGGSPELANIIANTFSGDGVVITGSSTGDSVRANMIYNNRSPIGGLAIDLGRDGVTPNNSHVGQTGPNNWQNFPVLTTAVADSATRVLGTLNSTPNTTFTIDFYANDPDKGSAGANGEGQYYLGSATVITDGSGNVSFNVSGLAATTPGEWISATATDPGGNTSEFALDVQAVGPASLSGMVFADFNNDGQVDFGEQGIPGVPISLTGSDAAGDPVNLNLATDGAGTYVFLDLPPGTYTITEVQQPAGYTQGINIVGTGGGTMSGDQFTGISLSAGQDAMNYNFGERPAATGPIQRGQTAEIGFWNNQKGQALIKVLNGGAGTQLGDWLARTFPHMFGALSGSNNLAGQNNAAVASFFQSRFVVHGQKLDAQVLATALAVYVTDPILDSTGVGTQYGFTVSGNGVATATYNVGTNGAAFGVADNTTMTVMDLLLAADAQAVNGLLYNGNTTKRTMANTVFSAINQAGGI
jgi:hypothetical protein